MNSNKKQTILEWYQKNHIYIDAPCNGKGNCGRCKIKFLSNAPSASRKDLRLLSFEELKAGVRLACTTERAGRENFLPVGEFLQQDIFVPQAEYRRECDRLNSGKTALCIQNIEDNGIEHEEIFGIALDIGTTTLAMSLIGLTSRTRFATVTQVNHQRSFGSDVISRIQAANEGHLFEMREVIQMDLLELLGAIIEKTEIRPEQITKMTIVGNTVMCHILQGFSCKGLGCAPFHPVSTALAEMKIKELFSNFSGLPKQKILLDRLEIEVTILPGLSAFIGSDVTAGLYACDMDAKEECQMLIDVGTNGEMVIGNRKGFLLASAAAGPVFEAGGISCGMPACSGAVSHIRCVTNEVASGESDDNRKICRDKSPNKKDAEKWEYQIIGPEGSGAKGLCGSGLIDLVSELWRLGRIDENGTFCEEYFESGFCLPQWEEEFGKGRMKPIVLSQTDIRELQMGKAAIRAGVEILIKKMQPKKLEIKKVYLAGGFGTAIDIGSAMEINLFPKQFSGMLEPVGNTALLGGEKYLLDEDGEKRMRHIVEISDEITLAKEADFQEKYIHFMQFLI